jgi:hypothetical protein
MSEVPCYSFVATSRNDDHGGDVLRRTQSFINRLAEQCERHQVRAELVLVEWNPPNTRPSLEDVLGWPAGSEWFSARLIIVSSALHGKLEHSNRLEMFQMIAKNVGIRRAAGQYIVATNIDIIFSDEIFERLGRRDFRKGVVYRSDRWDIPNEIQLEQNLDRLLKRARQEAIRRNLKDGPYVKRDGLFVNITGTRFDNFYHNPLEKRLQELRETLEQKPSPASRDDGLSKLNYLIDVEVPRLRRNYLTPLLHVHACGDFTMMSRHDWLALRGYPEWNIFSWNIDALLLYQAHYNGLEISELDETCVHYHIEHDHGSGWTPEGEASLRDRLDGLSIPYIWYDKYFELIYELQDKAKAKCFTVYNETDWGFVGEKIESRNIVDKDTSRRPPSKVNDGPLTEGFLNGLPYIRLDLSQVDGIRMPEGTDPECRPGSFCETRPETWSYAIEHDLSALPGHGGERWFKITIAVDQGIVGVGILNSERTEFLVEKYCRGPDRGFHEVMCYIKEITQASRLVFRNATPDNQPARFCLKEVRVLAAAWTEDDPGVADPEQSPLAESSSPVVTTAALRQEDGPARLLEPVELQKPAAASLADIKPGAPNVIVRVLPSWTERVADTGGECQAMIILPSATGGYASAVLDLSGVERCAGRVRVYLHVLEGEAVIGLKAGATGEFLAESRERAGPALTQIDLDANGAEAASALVIRNTSLSGPAKLLLHRVECPACLAAPSAIDMEAATFVGGAA